MGQKAAALSFDANNISSLAEFVERFQELLQSKWKKQTFDFLINNAGIGATIPFAEVTEEVFTKYLAKELGSKKITINVVAPGPVATDFNNGGNRDIPERNKFLASQTSLGRVGQASDIGGVIAFLCSEDAGWINGQRIEITGGINL